MSVVYTHIECAEPGVVELCSGIDGRFDGEHFAGHANFQERWIPITDPQVRTSSVEVVSVS